MKKSRENKGITIIALVVTIIILLILTGVTIATLTVENGLLQRSEIAKEENKGAKELELIKLAVSATQAEGQGIITTENLNKELKANFNNDTEVSETLLWWIYKGNRSYKISKEGKVEEGDLLPDEYQQIEYIESRGAQCIDTEYIFRKKPKVIGEIMITLGEDRDIMGNSMNKSGCYIIDFASSKIFYRYSSATSTGVNSGIIINKWYNFEFSDKIKVNGNEILSIDSYDFSQNDQSFLIGKGRNYGYAKFKEIEMYDGDELVRYLIPCYRKYDNKVGMYDVLNNKFYTNKSGDDFYCPPQEELLPNEDCELEYIETTGVQYIDTGYVFKSQPKVIGEIMITSGGDLDIMGNSTVKEGCFIIDFNGAGGIYYRYSSINSSMVSTDITANTWHSFCFSDKIKIDNNEKYSTSTFDFLQNDQSFLIGKGRNYGWAKFKEIKMYDGDILVRDMIPYYRKSDNKVGMYDKVNEIFYTNQGVSDDFIAGPKK